MSSQKIDKLVRMANQIGDFYATMPEAEAASGVATHLKLYWTPKMIGELIAWSDEGKSGLNPTAAQAVASLKSAAAV